MESKLREGTVKVKSVTEETTWLVESKLREGTVKVPWLMTKLHDSSSNVKQLFQCNNLMHRRSYLKQLLPRDLYMGRAFSSTHRH